MGKYIDGVVIILYFPLLPPPPAEVAADRSMFSYYDIDEFPPKSISVARSSLEEN